MKYALFSFTMSYVIFLDEIFNSTTCSGIWISVTAQERSSYPGDERQESSKHCKLFGKEILFMEVHVPNAAGAMEVTPSGMSYSSSLFLKHFSNLFPPFSSTAKKHIPSDRKCLFPFPTLTELHFSYPNARSDNSVS